MIATLYNICIRPVEYLIELIFVVMHQFLGRPGYAVIALSLAVSTLTLPLYARAEAVAEKERELQKKMEHWTGHIRSTFHGDERYMLLQAYYAEQGYKPLYALKGTMTLLLQVPFFLAAYHFLSGLYALQGCAFGPIADLGAEDGLLQLGGMRLNLLPILMTVINILSGLIYTKGFPVREKIQPFVLALVFLVLLYHSPSGLVVYWTMNNIYSLVKNVVMKYLRHPERVLSAAAAVTGIGMLVFLFTQQRIQQAFRDRQWEELFVYTVAEFLLFLPLIRRFLPKSGKAAEEEGPKWITPVAMLLLTVLPGFVLPLFVISSYPADFVVLDRTISPLHYAYFTLSVFAGIFCVWGGLIHLLSDAQGKERYRKVLSVLSVVCLMNAFAFHAVVGNVSTFLHFDYIPKYAPAIRMLNLFLTALIGFAVWHFWKHIRLWLGRLLTVALFSLITISGYELYRAKTELAKIEIPEEDTSEHSIPFSTGGKNVVVIMLDRAISGYVPFMFEEKPELLEQFSGFTYYPNTVSYGGWTVYSAPSLFGGYDYTPARINERPEEKLSDKHDEALRVMPVIFGSEGYTVTAADLPLVHYGEFQDPHYLDGYVDAEVFDLTGQSLALYGTDEYRQVKERNFVFYGIYKIMPAFLQDEIYDNGNYLTANRREFMKDSFFLKSLAALKKLPEITVVSDDDSDHFFMMDNNTTHQPEVLPLPDYDIEQMSGNDNYDIGEDRELNGIRLHFDRGYLEHSVGHYHCNMAAFLALGNWFDEMRRQGVYDNTRIIIVSDHGFELGQFEHMISSWGLDAECVNALLMFKDFDSQEYTVSENFMTPGDVSALATQGLIEDCTNPFTGNPISMETAEAEKEIGADIIWVENFEVGLNQDAYIYLPEDVPWYRVRENVFDFEKWDRIK